MKYVLWYTTNLSSESLRAEVESDTDDVHVLKAKVNDQLKKVVTLQRTRVTVKEVLVIINLTDWPMTLATQPPIV